MKIARNLFAAGLVLATALSANAAFAFQRWVDIVNEGASAIYSVHITHVDDRRFGRDLLGNYMIPAGYEMRVEPDINNGYCRFDVRITYETGYELTLWGVNLCEVTTILADEHDALAI
jgi:hypothetical protein